MSRFIADMDLGSWQDHINQLRADWTGLTEQAAGLQAGQEETIGKVFSGAGLSKSQADVLLKEFLASVQEHEHRAGLAQFLIRREEGGRILPPTFEDISSLTTHLRADWDQMLFYLEKQLRSRRDTALIGEARAKVAAEPSATLKSAVLMPLPVMARLCDPQEDESLASAALNQTVAADGGDDPISYASRIATLFGQSLRLRHEMEAFKAFWAGSSEPVRHVAPPAAAVKTGPSHAAPGVWDWLFFRRKKTAKPVAPAANAVAPWLEPLPADVPADAGLLYLLSLRRQEANREADALRDADARLTAEVDKVQAELAARKATCDQHPAAPFDPETIGCAELGTAEELLNL